MKEEVLKINQQIETILKIINQKKENSNQKEKKELLELTIILLEYYNILNQNLIERKTLNEIKDNIKEIHQEIKKNP